jgi:cytosine deaminase
MHIDESDDGSVRTLEMVAKATIARGWQGRVTAAHVCPLSAADDEYASPVASTAVSGTVGVMESATTALQA